MYDYIGGDGSRDPSHPATPNGFHPSWGNYGVDSLGECGVPTVHRFTGPANGNGLFWYSFDYGAAGAELETTPFSPALGSWSVAHVNAWGYLRAEASSDALHIAFVRNDNGNVYDQVTLHPWKEFHIANE
ncbi:hypothetical protein DYB32_002439 [Aphanomyces invadans]|uniref:Purple acid phosphatase C-terminal domain-containing protein n=1 Tax=Aphanomyces invadans TaxID=157072 RepID=A0A3R7ACM3_9STRA|nr:hypothetical protein DYB32_002439 [Aphanomyces invadans]